MPYKKSSSKSQKAFEFKKKCSNHSGPSYILLGDSFISRLEWCHKKLSDGYFSNWLNLGIGGDKAENLLWRVNNGGFPIETKKAFISIGTNNIFKNNITSIVNTIIKIGEKIQEAGSEIFICGQYPRSNDIMSKEIAKLNELLESKCTVKRMRFIKTDDLFWKNGTINIKLFSNDRIHLSSFGYKMFCENLIKNMYKPSLKEVTNELISPPSKDQANNISYK